MSYTAPTLADFRTRFPEFQQVADELVEAVLAESAEEVGLAWGDRRSTATLYLTAHILASEGGTSRADAASGHGQVVQIRVGEESTTFASPQVDASADSYNGTRYGRRFAKLRGQVFAGSVYAV